MKILPIFLLLAFSIISCKTKKGDADVSVSVESKKTTNKSNATKEVDLSDFEPKVREIAERICECAQPYLDFQKKAMTGGKMTDEQAADFTANMQDAMAELGFCMQDLQEEYPDFEPDTQFKKQLRKAMRKKCPGSLVLMAQYLE